MKIFFFLALAFLTSCSHSTIFRTPSSSQAPILETVEIPALRIKLRAGFTPEAGELKGCVLYLEGLADSVRNHEPFFSYLSNAGYRVIYFDYMGQGGSEGSMDNTRIKAELPPNATKEMLRRHDTLSKFYEIPEQASLVWNRYSNGCPNKKVVIGWSTGGLAAYRMAAEKLADAVVLLAPGISPKMMVGEAQHRWDKMLMFRSTISERTLTRNTFSNEENPHLDPPAPTSPSHVPTFAGNLLGVASHSRQWKIPATVPGIVFLSGAEDSYVNRDNTISVLKENAPHFTVRSYDGALHELDNEIPEVTKDLYPRIVEFLQTL